IVVAEKENAVRFQTQHSLRLYSQRQAIDRGLTNSVTELIDWITFFIEALHHAKCSAVDRRSEEPRNGGIAKVLGRNTERRELALAVMKEARVEKLNPDQLLSLAGANAKRGGAQLVHEIDVGQLEQTERAGVARIAATVLDHARPLLFDIDDDV